MNAEILMYVVTALVLVVHIYGLIWLRWNLPDAHGPGFFMGVEVASEFHGAPAIQWTKRYHALILAELVLVAGAAGWLVVFGLWRWLPAWAGGIAVIALLNIRAFEAWVRRSVPAAKRAEVGPAVAFSLEVRRLGDYLSWVSEALLAATLGVSWMLLLTRGAAGWRWQSPAVWTYLAVASSLWKVSVVRSGVPLPADRAEEHQRWLSTRRRYSVRVFDCFSWFAVLIVAGYAALYSSPANSAAPWLRWMIVALVCAVWTTLVVVTVRGQLRLASTGGGLRPMESWRGLSGQGNHHLPPGGVWGVGFVAGLVLLIALNFWGL